MLVSILLVGFVILGLFLSMVSSRPRADVGDAVPFLPHPGEKPTQHAASDADQTELLITSTTHA